MQTLVQVICSKGKSLRDFIVNDPKIELHDLQVGLQKKPGRSRGWAKIYSTQPDRRGVLNITWNSSVNILLCRVITKGEAKPHLIIGDFVDYLLHRCRRRIETINIVPR